MVKTARGPYKLHEWERVEGGVLFGPGFAFDLENDDILWFVSPSAANTEGYGTK